MTLRLPIPARCLLLGLMLISFAGQAQVKKNRGPIYEDETIIIYKNLVQLRVPAGFYVYSFAQKSYEKTHTPILLGGRFEHLLNSRLGFGIDLEYDYYNPLPSTLSGDRQFWTRDNQIKYMDTPDFSSMFKLTPHLRAYLRGKKNKKRMFNGVFIGFGPSVIATQVLNEQKTTYRRLSARFAPAVYDNKTMFALSLIPGWSHCFPSGVTIGASVEMMFAPYQFDQEGLYKLDAGSGAAYLNPFRFMIGYRF